MLITVGLFILGLVLLVLGAEWLVRGASRLASAAGISPLVVGLTVVAFGTSAPELAVTVSSSLQGTPDIALGNVIGSNICNLLLILGLAALIAPLTVAQQLVRLEVPLLIAASLAMILMGWDGVISRTNGVVLFLAVVLYTIYAIWQSRREQRAVQAEYEREFGPAADAASPSILGNLALIVLGLVLLVLGARWLVAGAVEAARWLGISELVIGLTIIAIGTSLPEIAASVVASLRGERDIAVGNVVGSSLFNILAVLGITASVAPDGIPVSPAVLSFDLPIMLAATIACLPIFFTGYRIDRWEGGVFLFYYSAYLTLLVLDAIEAEVLPMFELALIGFFVPLTLLTIATASWRALRTK